MTTHPARAPRAVSTSRIDQRSCPECDSLVETEIWLIISRPERQLLWARARDGTLHQSRCARGHVGLVRASLLLFDPGTGVAMYSAAPGESPVRTAIDREILLELLLEALEAGGHASAIEVVDVPPMVLPLILASPRANVADFAPGVAATPELEEFYADMSVQSLEAALTDGGLEPGLAAAAEYELALQLRTQSGEQAESGDRRIELLHSALRFYDRASFPARWAAIQSELGTSYRSRVRGDRESNLCESIRREERALEVFTAERYPEDFAGSQMNLANALLDIGDRSPDTVGRAINAYQAALTVFSRLTYPEMWARVHTDLATALYVRQSGDDLATAARALEQALDMRGEEQDPFAPAISQMNLGLVLRSMSEKPGDENWLRAVASLRRAHEVLSGMSSTAESRAAAQNLGHTLTRSPDRGDLEESIVLLRRVRGLLFDGGDRTGVDDCTSDLAHAWLQLIQRSSTIQERYDLARLSIDLFDQECDLGIVGLVHYQASLDFFETESLPAAQRRALAKAAVKRALVIFRYRQDAERRAKALAQLGRIDTEGYREGRSEDRAEAQAAFAAAQTIATTLDDGPERNELVGHIHVMLAGLDATGVAIRPA